MVLGRVGSRRERLGSLPEAKPEVEADGKERDEEGEVDPRRRVTPAHFSKIPGEGDEFQYGKEGVPGAHGSDPCKVVFPVGEEGGEADSQEKSADLPGRNWGERPRPDRDDRGGGREEEEPDGHHPATDHDQPDAKPG